MKIIEDFNLEWHPETECVHVIVTHGDGTEEEVWSIKPPAVPAWVNGDERDYQEWYDDILEDLHKCGFQLSGEIA